MKILKKYYRKRESTIQIVPPCDWEIKMISRKFAGGVKFCSMKYLTYYIPDSKHIEELRQRIDDDECRCRTTAIHDDDRFVLQVRE